MSIKLAYDEAFSVTRFFIAELSERTWDMTWTEFHAAVADATLRLSWLIGSQVGEQQVRDLLDSYEQLNQLERGTHPDIKLNDTQTTDNRPQLRERIEANIADETYTLLQIAGITPTKFEAAA